MLLAVSLVAGLVGFSFTAAAWTGRKFTDIVTGHWNAPQPGPSSGPSSVSGPSAPIVAGNAAQIQRNTSADPYTQNPATIYSGPVAPGGHTR